MAGIFLLVIKTRNESSALIIIPILNGDIASSIPNSIKHCCAEICIVANTVAAAVRTVIVAIRN